MDYQRFDDHYVLRLAPDEEVAAVLTGFVERVGIRGGYFLAFGAFCRVRMRYFDFGRKEFKEFEVGHQVEVVSLLGNVARESGQTRLHMHAAVGDSDGRTYSGHIAQGVVRPTLEVFLTVLGGEVCRAHDPDTGLDLLSLSQRM